MDSLLGKLYQAAVHGELWPVFLEELARLVRADAMTLLASSADGGELREITFDVGTDPQAESDYRAYFAAIDPWVEAGAPEEPVGSVKPSQAILSEQELVRTEFYHDYYKPNGWHHGFGAKLFEEEGGLVATVTGHRHRNRGAFDTDEVQILARLVPHLRRALRIRQEIGRLSAERDAGAQLLERVAMGTILVDARARVVRTNRIADGILAACDGLSSGPEGLEAATPADTQALRRAIAGAAATSRGDAGDDPWTAGGQLRLRRPSGSRPYLVEVSPLDRDAGIWGAKGSLAAILVTDGSGSVEPDLEALRTFYGLTRAEAELAALLARGLSLDEASERRHVSRNTARGQLKRIFAKTGASRQADLVRMILQGPAGFAHR